MKILFLCGSLELGRDGVGDYVRRLAVELMRQGHSTTGVALSDQFVTEEISTVQSIASGDFLALRLPAAWPANQRFARAQQQINDFDPEWVSLQFVPFSYHNKGLPFFLGSQLAPLGKGRSWHVMFHELWVGMDRDSTLKYILWGRVQRLLIRSLLGRLKPRVIHTQTPLYHAHLAKLGFASQLLPLFANIPNMGEEASGTPALPSVTAAHKKEDIVVVAFGTIHPGAQIASFARDAARYAAQHSVSVTLTMVGRCGAEQEHWADTWKAAGLPVRILGEQAPEGISEALHTASLGVTTTPIALIGKSGTAAAMQEHGLPVLSLTRPWIPIDVPNPEIPIGILAYSPGNFDAFLIKDECSPIYNRLAGIAQQFTTALMNASSSLA